MSAMSTKKLLKGLNKIQDELKNEGPSESVEASIACLHAIARIYKAQLDYEKTMAEYQFVRVKLMEPFAVVSGKDRKNLAAALSTSRQIKRRLREIRITRAVKQ